MKKIISIGLLCLSFSLSAQTLSYGDMGILLTNENINGTARFNALSGAFGALGGDLSAVDINPAGAAVFRNSEFSASFAFRNDEITSNYYGSSTQNEYDFNNFSQAGAVFVFNTPNNSEWRNVVLGFNYSRTNDFDGSWIALGNSGLATWTGDEIDTDSYPYTQTTGQAFKNFTAGENKRYTFSIASQYNKKLYFGASINSYDINHFQQTTLEENNHDGNGNDLDASFLQELSTYGDGISFSIGLIAKPNKNIRVGLAYQSPIWYSLIEDSIEEDSVLSYSNTGKSISYYSGINTFSYELRTPSKLTGSLAYIFNKNGLISLDYTYKNYSNIHFKGNDFLTDNQDVKNDFNSSSGIRIGTEWRIDRLSLRGGYHTEQNPYKTAISSDNIRGFSLGAGLNFRGFKFDIAYQKDTNTAAYNFYPSDDFSVNSAELDIDTSKITATLTLKL
ncbi:MAG: hemin receptor [Flavobacteriaceae bacterium]|nr:MAG: hemin receptor [Flavobacteriaceae bacterium]